MLHCVLGEEQRKNCVNTGGLGKDMEGRCNQDYISCHRIRGKEWCDQYKEEPLRCDVCGVDTGKTGDGSSHEVGDTVPCPTVLCIYCHAIYDSIVHGKRSCFGHIGAMNMLKGLVDRARENEQ